MGNSAAQTQLGIFAHHTNIGPGEQAGFAYYDTEQQTYTIGGAGANMWADRDEFQYCWTTLQGDFILRAEGHFLGEGVDPHRKLGWIVKNDLATHTAHVNATVHGDGLTSLQFRRTAGGMTEEVRSRDSFPDVIQLERRGDTFIMSTARFGDTLTAVQLTNMPLDKEVYVGLYVCSHNSAIVETAVFRNVRIIRPAAPDFRPYQDYIGSNLELLEVATGHRTILSRSAHSLQAPNWTTDGQHLIYNSKGKLYQYGLADGSVNVLNTGFANNNNNDHVLSFDGGQLGISHHSEDEGGASTIYYLPTTGADKPVQVTRPGVGHSYLHGWSPDGQRLVFTGQRNGQYDIHTVDVTTGREHQLTNEPTLDDGPEYSPDGRHIFFNSVRTGTMQLWRMEADGSHPTQLTFDGYNDWFPHVSPDQRWIVFLSFPEDIDPSDHPFYRHCLVRLMPYEGGEPRVIGYIYGGQGSINVPSWSPDSRFIALVTNTQQ